MGCCTLLLAFALFAAAKAGSFWHLTDAHLQAEYKVGSSALLNCIKGKGVAGKYGDYIDCTTPMTLLDGSVEFMAKTEPNPDFFLWTGDISPHNWNTYNQEWSYGYARNVSTLIRKYFPKDIPVIPVLGNHDPYPQHMMIPGKAEFYDTVAELWKDILPEGAEDTFRMGGYYSAKLSQTLRVIALNSVLYYSGDKKVKNTDEDPAGQMKWLSNELAHAKANGERVIVAYHVPPGGWPIHLGPIKLPFGFQMYHKLNDAFIGTFSGYNDIISAHFCGHTHTDEFRMIRDKEENGNESVLFIAPSLTEAEYVDPRFRLMKFDSEYPHDVTGYDQYRVSLTEANKNERLDWYVEYSFNDLYGKPDCKASSMRALYRELMQNTTMQHVYLDKLRGFNIVGTVCDPIKLCATAFLCAIDSAKIADVNACKL